MCMCTYLCVCVCMCVHVSVCLCLYMYLCVCVSVSVCLCMCVCVHVSVYATVCLLAHMNAFGCRLLTSCRHPGANFRFLASHHFSRSDMNHDENFKAFEGASYRMGEEGEVTWQGGITIARSSQDSQPAASPMDRGEWERRIENCQHVAFAWRLEATSDERITMVDKYLEEVTMILSDPALNEANVQKCEKAFSGLKMYIQDVPETQEAPEDTQAISDASDAETTIEEGALPASSSDITMTGPAASSPMLCDDSQMADVDMFLADHAVVARNDEGDDEPLIACSQPLKRSKPFLAKSIPAIPAKPKQDSGAKKAKPKAKQDSGAKKRRLHLKEKQRVIE